MFAAGGGVGPEVEKEKEEEDEEVWEEEENEEEVDVDVDEEEEDVTGWPAVRKKIGNLLIKNIIWPHFKILANNTEIE